jgi:hypothetical protein
VQTHRIISLRDGLVVSDQPVNAAEHKTGMLEYG